MVLAPDCQVGAHFVALNEAILLGSLDIDWIFFFPFQCTRSRRATRRLLQIASKHNMEHPEDSPGGSLFQNVLGYGGAS